MSSSLRPKLDWFEHLPLFGERIVITRAKAQSAELWQRLHQLGADVIEIPVIEIAPLADYSALDEAIAQLETYEWVVFTSANTVDYFLQRLRACNRDWRAIRGRICASVLRPPKLWNRSFPI